MNEHDPTAMPGADDLSDSLFRSFAESMPQMAWIGDAEGNLYWYNQRWYAYTGTTREEMAGWGWQRVHDAQELPQVLERWRASLASGAPFDIVFPLRGRDGIFRPFLTRAVPQHDAQGRVVRWFGTNTDISQQRGAEARLQMLNTHLETEVTARARERSLTWQVSPDLLCTLDSQGRFEAANPAWQTVLGWSASELVGRSFVDFLHADDVERSRASFEQVMMSQTAQRIENRWRHRDGSHRWIAWVSVAEGGQMFRSGRDITEERLQAEALARAEEALRQSQKMESIGQLTGGIAHDFNNLLQVISGNLMLIEKHASNDPKVLERVQKAKAAVQRGANLSGQLLAFGRKQPLQPRVVHVGRLVNEFDEMLRRTLGEGIQIESIVGGGLWNTFVDPSQLQSAILNLALNARDAMNGTGRLTIEVQNAAIDDAYARNNADMAVGQYVVLVVTDTGEGMSPAVQAQAFEPFFTTKPVGQGTGLGLAMVYGFLKQSGGNAKIYSEAGVGTSVRLYMPRSRLPVEAPDDAGLGPGSVPAEGGTETVLVVEDDSAVRATSVALLADLGYRVLQAADASSALAVVNSGARIDLLFTDVVMPGSLKCTELAALARSRIPGIAVLYTSGYTENSVIHNGRLDPGIELLSKPYTSEQLARKVRLALSNEALRSVKPAG